MGKKFTLSPLKMEDASTYPEWYTIVVKHNYEKKYSDDLLHAINKNEMEDRILEVVAPLKEELVMAKNRKGEMREKSIVTKIYPLYIFVKCIMDPQVWSFLRSVDGFITVLATGGAMITISNEEMDQIKDQCGILEKELEARRQVIYQKMMENKTKFNSYIGKNVKIINGMFANFEGPLKGVDFDKNRATVTIMNSNVNIDIIDIELIN